jgi:hypothetical protein
LTTTKKFAIADPRFFEGDPYEVAQRAAQQASAVAGLLREAIDGAYLMVRNADLERQLALDGECSVEDFEDGVHAKQLKELAAQADKMSVALATLGRAAAYNPKARIGR